VIPASVAYARASDLEHALELLGEPDAKAIAGGQSLLSVMKLRIARPSLVVDLSQLPLRGVELRSDAMHVGALTTWVDLTSDPAFGRPAFAAIAECARGIGDLQVRNRGTIGGSLAHADPASDMTAVLLALGATVTLRSAASERSLDLDDFLLGPFTTALEPVELITEVVIPVPEPGSGSAYASVEHPASGFPLAGAAAVVHGDGRTTIAITGIADRPFLAGDDADAALEATEIFGDRFAPAEYRRDIAGVVARRALEAARACATEDRT
jgi:carbon-monoxide dehydrogenase medium subunit